jgi:hypothetical protein
MKNTGLDVRRSPRLNRLGERSSDGNFIEYWGGADHREGREYDSIATWKMKVTFPSHIVQHKRCDKLKRQILHGR